MNKKKIALVYDFDKTLATKDMQEFHYLKSLGFNNPLDFWNLCKKNSIKYNCDSISSYLFMMLKLDKNLSKDKLIDEGKYIKYYKGVDTWFDRVNKYAKSKGLEVEHYIISCGLKDMIIGTPLNKNFKEVFACTFIYDENKKPMWPARIVNYTMKTQYLFRINNGITNELNDIDLNKSIPDDKKYIPFTNMMYFGDGLTDVPSMKVVLQNGGKTCAVFDSKTEALAKQLQIEQRASYAIKADYSKGSKAEKIVFSFIDFIDASNKFEKLK